MRRDCCRLSLTLQTRAEADMHGQSRQTAGWGPRKPILQPRPAPGDHHVSACVRPESPAQTSSLMRWPANGCFLEHGAWSKVRQAVALDSRHSGMQNLVQHAGH